MPSKFKAQQITIYNGKTDPPDHICAHIMSLLGKGATDEIHCPLFLGAVKGMAGDWFNSLAPNYLHQQFCTTQREFIVAFCRVN